MADSRRPPEGEDQNMSQRNIIYIVGVIILILVIAYFLGFLAI